METDLQRGTRMQRLLREVNQTVVEVNRTLGAIAGVDVLCECGDACGSFVTLQVGDYVRVRSEPLQFCVLPGHERRGVDQIVERHERWLLVAARPTDD